MSEEEVVYPSLYERFLEKRVDRFVTKPFKKTMMFVFGSNSAACSLTPVDLIKSAAVYLMSSGAMYSVIDEYTRTRYIHHRTFREAMMASLIVFFADISHRYAGHARPRSQPPNTPPPPPPAIPKRDNDSGYTGFPGGV